MSALDIEQRVYEFTVNELASITGRAESDFSRETPLLGANSNVKSRQLVELLLALEEFAEDEVGAEFDWTSDSAMSEARSVFRTIGTLVEHIAGLSAGA